MATKTKASDNGDVDVEAVDDKAFRLSITLDPSLRRHIRIASAIADKTVGEWAAAILTRAADKAIAEDLSVE